MNHTFAEHVRQGLSADAKFLSSKYFYDANGDRLFQAIMASPEYYLTDCEYEILSRQKQAILEALPAGGFDLVELGSGDGKKTRILLGHFCRRHVDFRYLPIDISDSSLEGLAADLSQELPDVKVLPVTGEYLDALSRLPKTDQPRVFLFLGSNIGNFLPAEAAEFLRTIRSAMREMDHLYLGVDLKKHPQVVLSAYNDAGGITRAFNLNLLRRINRELGADFDLRSFEHYPAYDAQTGTAKSFLVSRKEQIVRVAALNGGGRSKFEFAAGESIFVEVSQKYSICELDRLAAEAGFRIEQRFFDSRGYFTNQLWCPADP